MEAPPGQYIYLYFSSFHLEYGSAYCPWDFVEIFDGHSEQSSSKIIRACGQLAPWTVYSSGRFLLVKFYSDNIIMMPGFSAYYQAVLYSKRNRHFMSLNNRGKRRGKREKGSVRGVGVGVGVRWKSNMKKDKGARFTI